VFGINKWLKNVIFQKEGMWGEEGGMGVFLEHEWHVLTFSKIM
jgi:hypothetical protein